MAMPRPRIGHHPRERRSTSVTIGVVFVVASMISGALLFNSLASLHLCPPAATVTGNPGASSTVVDERQHSAVTINEEATSGGNKRQERTPAKINADLISTLFEGKDPFDVPSGVPADWTYRHTNFNTDFFAYIAAKHIFPNFFEGLTFHLEVGSFKAGSVIRLASLLKEKNASEWGKTSLVCIDPFTGDVNMWLWQKIDEKGIHVGGPRSMTKPITIGQKLGRSKAGDRVIELKADAPHDYLDMGVDGRPRVFDRFKANVLDKRHEDMILPIQATGLVGMKLILKLKQEGRISDLPQMLYLDSAHEEGETYLELQTAWKILPPCAVLYGDDWNWDGVQKDLVKFANELHLPPLVLFNDHIQLTQPLNGVGLMGKSQWFMQKPADNTRGACKVDDKAWW